MLIPSASSQEYVGRGKPRASHWNWTFSVSTPSVSTGSVTQLGGSCTWWYRCTSEVSCQCLKSVVYWDVWSQLSMSKVSCLLRCLKSVVYVWSQLSTRDIWSQLSTEISEVSCLRRCLTSRLMSLSSSSPVWGTLALQVYVPPSLFLTDLMIRPSGSITYRSPAGRINSLLIVTTSFFSSFLPNDKNDFSIERRSSFIHILLLIIGFQ